MVRAALIAVLAFTGGLAHPGVSGAGGPWRAQVVDAETEQPMEGVVIRLVWLKMTRTLGGPSGSYHSSEEMVTGPDGRFEAKSRRTFTLNPLTYIDGPLVTIFKPGYGRERVREVKPEWEEMDYGETLEQEGIVIELQQLKTRQERLEFYQNFRGWSVHVPDEKARRMREALDRERAYLGFRN
jgi:hypothetical protein